MECTRLVAVAVAVAAALGMLVAGFSTSPAVAAAPGPAAPGAADPIPPVISIWASGSFRASNRAW